MLPVLCAGGTSSGGADLIKLSIARKLGVPMILHVARQDQSADDALGSAATLTTFSTALIVFHSASSPGADVDVYSGAISRTWNLWWAACGETRSPALADSHSASHLPPSVGASQRRQAAIHPARCLPGPSAAPSRH